MDRREEQEDAARFAVRASLAIAPAVLLAGIAGGIAFPILPIVGVRAHLPLWFIGAILAANRAARVVSNPIVGMLADRVGGRRTLLAGTLIQAVVMGSYAAGVVSGHPGAYFLGGRLLHGPGSSCVFVSAQALALHAGGRMHGGRASSVVRIALGIGVPIGLVVGGLVSDVLGDATTFLAAALAVLIAYAVARFTVPDLRVTHARRASLRDVVHEFADRRLAAVGVLSFVAAFSASGMVLTTITLLVGERAIALAHFGVRGTSGALMGWMVLVDALAMVLFGRVGDRTRSHARIAALGVALLVPGLAWTGVARTAAGLAGGLAIIGIGTGALGPSLLVMVGMLVPPERRGTAVGLLQLSADAGGMLGPLIGTALLAGDSHLPYLVTAGLLACTVPVAVWLATRRAAPSGS